MFGKSNGKSISAMVVQTRNAANPGAVTGLIWSDGAPRDAGANPAGRVRGLFIEGKVCGDADISVNGHIKGDVDVASLTLDEEGMIEGDITAEQVEIHGRVIGDICAGLIKLHPRAVVQGDLTYLQLSIELGADFQGGCHHLSPAAQPDATLSGAARAVAPADATPADALLADGGQAEGDPTDTVPPEPAEPEDEFAVPPMPPEDEESLLTVPLQTTGKPDLAGASRPEKNDGLLN